MNGFIVAGKAFCVIEDLRQEAERHKGKTVAEFLQKRKLEKLQQAEAKQFGTSVETIRVIE
jgi:hypothetical protein